MSELNPTKFGASRPRATSHLHLPVAATTFSCLIGLADFVLHELWGQPSRIMDYVLYKPTFLGFSSLLIHLLIVIAIAWILVGGLISLRCVLMRLTRSPVGFLPPATLSIVLVALLLISLRLFKESPTIVCSSIFICVVACLGATSLVLERHSRASISQLKSLRNAHRVLFAVSAVTLVGAFFAPDLTTIYSEWGRQPARLPSARPNVVLIVLDTVRVDRLSCYGSTTVSTPNIDRLAREGLLFLNAFSTAPWTVPSHASMFTGLYPSQHQATWDNTSLRDEFVTLAERLSEAGYVCAGFSENPFVGVANGFAQGFTEFHETWRRPLLERAVIRTLRALGRRYDLQYAPRTTSLLDHWLATTLRDGRPLFAFVNLMAAHLPNYPRTRQASETWPDALLARIEPVNLVPERYYLPQYRLDQSELKAMSHIYDDQIRYLDGYVGRIIGSLEKRGALDDTVLILASDHGENFGEHGYIEHQFCLYNTLIHIPLILHYPRVIEPALMDYAVSTISTYSTILDFANITQKSPEMVTQQPLQEIATSQTIVAEYPNSLRMLKVAIGNEASNFDYAPFDRDLQCILAGNYKYIWSSDGKHELYSIPSDLSETLNVAESEHQVANDLLDMLVHWRQDHPPLLDSGVVREVDTATRDALKTLGYEQ